MCKDDNNNNIIIIIILRGWALSFFDIKKPLAAAVTWRLAWVCSAGGEGTDRVVGWSGEVLEGQGKLGTGEEVEEEEEKGQQ